MDNAFKLIVGLGNPGAEYADTRHNAGFWLLNALADCCSASPWKYERKFYGYTAKLKTFGGEIWLLKPDTYMNRSGQSVQALASFYKIPTEAVLVVHDELDILPGHIRFKRGGGNGGHNGLKDIQAKLGSADFYRLRLGIGHPGDRNEVASYVLKKPAPADRASLDEALAYCLDYRSALLQGDTPLLQRVLHAFKPSAAA